MDIILLWEYPLSRRAEKLKESWRNLHQFRGTTYMQRGKAVTFLFPQQAVAAVAFSFEVRILRGRRIMAE